MPEVIVKAAPDNKRVWVLHHRQGEVGNYPFTFRANEDVSRDQWITEIDEHKNDLREYIIFKIFFKNKIILKQ